MNITPHCYSLSEKLVAALIVTGECGAETIAVTITKMQSVYFQIFRDTLILVFVNENCCLCICFTALFSFYY